MERNRHGLGLNDWLDSSVATELPRDSSSLGLWPPHHNDLLTKPRKTAALICMSMSNLTLELIRPVAEWVWDARLMPRAIGTLGQRSVKNRAAADPTEHGNRHSAIS